ncbi:hypothetical protein [Daejeonella lutea]|uniref:DUF1735 domain-containing protein n=1 Tax=Daejeonella lutea TaxID=572036 RepID=A0A1T5BE78_9SPHI|nr:hypothetical protein [Daejeonella lutea]SKB45592.1 hypothetical protein SAMN05661099_1532 [Daejeonella lutea]
MKSLTYITLASIMLMHFTSCEDNDYEAGTPEFDNHYYAAYLPNNNTKVTVTKNQTALVKFPVQFYSAFVRSYDAVAVYEVSTTGITAPAVLGKDFNIVDKNGAVIASTDGKYKLVFPKAAKATDTIYVKLLNNPATGTRSVDINIIYNILPDYRVDMFSTANKRPLEIR